jgi:guanyl-specific ribonuclease Sa
LQWTSPDPLAVHSLTGDANVYAYVQGKSLATVDPDGRCELICLIIVGAVVGAAFNAASTVLAGGAVTWATLYVGAVGGALAPVGGAALGPVIAPAFAFLGPMAPMVATGAGAGLATAMGTGGAEEAVRPGATPGGVLKGMFDPTRLAFGAAMGAALAGLTYAGTEALRGAQQSAPKPGAAPNATPTAPPATGGPGSAPVTPSVQPYEAPELTGLRSDGHAMPKLELPRVNTPGAAPKPPTPAWARPLKIEISRGPEGQVSVTFAEDPPPRSVGAMANEDVPSIPSRASDTLRHVRSTGQPPPGQVGGRVFQNDGRGGGRILPRADARGNPITYREFDVRPYVPGVNRGAERVVVGSDGRAWYTDDHYASFLQM